MSERRCGIIFDMDELLVDTRPIWRLAEDRMLEAMGSGWTQELAIRYKGMSAQNVAATAHAILQPPLPVEHYQKIMRDALIAAYAQGEIIPMPGAVELVGRLHGLAPLAIASGSPIEGIAKVASRLGIESRLDVILSSDSVPRGKPAPDVFLKAAQLLGCEPGRCVVFEDSLHGVQAARAAGMKVFAVPSIPPHQIAPLATRVFTSLAEVTLDHVREALGS